MSNQIPMPKEVYGVKEIAKYLCISESKVRQLIRRKAIPYVKNDGSYKFYLPVAREWLRRITVQPTPESEAERAQQTANGIWNSVGGR
jgi:excisionase family DNA binding protein